MADRIKLSEVAQAVRDTRAVIAQTMPVTAEPGLISAVAAVVLRELLDFEYDNDLDGRKTTWATGPMSS